MRKQIAAANWKMNLNYVQAKQLLSALASETYSLNHNRIVVLAVPFPYLHEAVTTFANYPYVFVAAQNCSDKKQGAYTGEVSVDMLNSLGVEFVIIGHSERREYYHEDNAMLANKVNITIEAGLVPIFCCGESLPIREANQQNEFVANQLKESLFHLDAQAIERVVIAYEPIWAIGTGKTATAEQAQDMLAFIRQQIQQQYGAEVAEKTSILYGGSVKGNNALELFTNSDVDGGLVGGASLVASEFVSIINSLK